MKSPGRIRGSIAGAKGTHAEPMPTADRLANYREQTRGGQLTPRQKRRLVKKNRRLNDLYYAAR